MSSDPFSHMRDLKVGDRVVRMLAGQVRMELKITKIDASYIYCGIVDGNFEGWKFDKNFGYEVDEDLGWGQRQADGSIYTGSYLVGKADG